TRFRSGDSPYRMGFEPIRLLQRISSVALSPPIPTLQALPGATMFIFSVPPRQKQLSAYAPELPSLK
ncbi:MAG: hypothetical protein ABIN18_14035, partial [Pseudomonadota bacterium]